ncbi:MAG: hypothetical protein AAFY08_04280 [Planctomycetota bacterium]
MYVLLALLGYLAFLGAGLCLLALTAPRDMIHRDPLRQREERGAIYYHLDTDRRIGQSL